MAVSAVVVEGAGGFTSSVSALSTHMDMDLLEGGMEEAGQHGTLPDRVDIGVPGEEGSRVGGRW